MQKRQRVLAMTTTTAIVKTKQEELRANLVLEFETLVETANFVALFRRPIHLCFAKAVLKGTVALLYSRF